MHKPGSDEHIENVELRTALQDRYLAYALSTIMHRALPDVRDGLKPVHRRIIYAMQLLKLTPQQAYAKCARIVGDVMGKYHPHGDASIYEALVRFAQDFAVRYPLIDGQGNFGNIDGDNPAAMRYTEARMTDVASFLLQGINENAIDFRPTYNEEDEEPVVLPGAFPNLLANGASGIAVGMATNIPPHNILEICDAAQYLITHKEATNEDLLEFIKGPDFPTGAVLVEPEEQIRENYRTGKGSFRLRARWHKEDTGRGGYVVVVTQIPYQVQKSRLIEKTAELLIARKLPMLEDIRDESAEDVRIVLEPKSRTIDATLLMESLFKLTDFEVRVPLNMNVLTYGKIPRVLSLKEMLIHWLEHRKDVLIRRAQYRNDEITKRLEILRGYLIAYLNLDEVIRIIREEDDAKKELIKAFELSDMQAEAILNMRLRSLRRLEEIELKKEYDKLEKEQKNLQSLLSSATKQWQAITKEIASLKEKYQAQPEIGERRTVLEKAPERDLQEIRYAMIEKNPVTLVISEKGWVRALKGHFTNYDNLSFKEGDSLKFAFPAYTTDKLSIFSTGGRFFTVDVCNLSGGRGHGDPIRILIDLENDQDIHTAFIYNPERKLLIASQTGNGFIVEEKETLSTTRKGKQVLTLKQGEKASVCKFVEGDHVAVVGENRKLLVFPLAQLPQMSKGKGVRLQKYKDGIISDVITFNLEEGLKWQDSAQRVFVRQKTELLPWLGERASAGRMVPNGFPRSGKF